MLTQQVYAWVNVVHHTLVDHNSVWPPMIKGPPNCVIRTYPRAVVVATLSRSFPAFPPVRTSQSVVSFAPLYVNLFQLSRPAQRRHGLELQPSVVVEGS